MEIMATRDDVTVRVDTELRAKARDLGINLSRLLEDTLRDEIERLEARTAAAADATEEIRIDLEDREGRRYVGRFTGKLLGEARGTYAYLLDDERVIVYDVDRLQYWENPTPLEDWFPHDPEVYIEILHGLGEKPEVDL
jgi:post-segregation antitoxin (ccd killing protein)